ncbi:MAG: serine/threonine protein kinase [Myxococcales bacterium]
MAFRAELDEGPEPKRSSASQRGDTLSFPPSFQRGDTLHFPSSPEIGASLAPTSGIRASNHDLEEGRLSGVLSTNPIPVGIANSERARFGESERTIGDVIADRYVLESEIAHGGMGVVWRAYDRERGQHVAVKLVAPHRLVHGDAAARLCAEATLLMLIDSPHVAKILDAGTTLEGEPYLVIELLQGVTLQQLIAVSSSVPVSEAVGWICQAASGLADVHQVGLVHDDVKPSNLFLAEVTGEQASIKLLDFGVARILSDPQAVTARGEIFGNPCYMAPERIAGSWYADHRADIWSLGVVLYELTTGQRPFDGDTLDDICAAVAAASPRPIRELRPEVNPELEQAVLRCLQPRPEDRYPNARLLLIDLKRSVAPLPSTVSAAIPREMQADASALANSASVAQSDEVGVPALVTQSDAVAGVHPASVIQSDSSVTTQSLEARSDGSVASIRAAKLRSIVQAPSFKDPGLPQQHFVAARLRDEPTGTEAPTRRRRRWPAIIAYTIAIGVSLVGIIGVARTLRVGRSSVESDPPPQLDQRASIAAQGSPTESTPQQGNQTQTTQEAPPSPGNAMAVPETSTDAAPLAQPGETTSNVLPAGAADSSGAPQPSRTQTTTPNVNARPWVGRSRANLRTYDTSQPRGTPLNEVHINARGELTDAKGRPLPKAGAPE